MLFNENFIQTAFRDRRNPFAHLAEVNFQNMVLFGAFNEGVLSRLQKEDSLPYYIKNGIPDEIKALLNQKEKPTEKDIRRFYLDKAVQVLEGYENCPVPMRLSYKDGRISLTEEGEKTVPSFLPKNGQEKKKGYFDSTVGCFIEPQKQDLLSEKGHERLKELKACQKKEEISDETLRKAIEAGNKFMLDMSLFKDFPGLDQFKEKVHEIKNVIVSATCGCYGNCSHCGYNASSNVRHMPYPMIIKIFNQLDLTSKSTIPMLYSDSDPLAYYDPIIGADTGDICYKLREKNPGFYTPIVTKGLLHLQPENIFHTKEAVSFGKLLENSQITLSYVDLPGENIPQNTQRIKTTLRVAKCVPQRRLDTAFTSPTKVSHITLDKDKTVPDIPIDETVFPFISGRFKETCRKFGLNPDGKTHFFAGEALVFRADGNICTTRENPLDKGCCQWDIHNNLFSFKNGEIISNEAFERLPKEPLKKGNTPSAAKLLRKAKGLSK